LDKVSEGTMVGESTGGQIAPRYSLRMAVPISYLDSGRKCE
jgi:hypothetical protein